MRLGVAPEASELGLIATDLIAEGLQIRRRDEEFERYKQDLCERLRDEYSNSLIEGDPVLAGFRELRSRVGSSHRKLPCSTESLIRFLLRNGRLPSINVAVDAYNCVSLDTKLTMGAHDLERIAGGVSLRLARGDERFVPLGATEPEVIRAGEYGYFDDEEVLCRLDYKQAEKSKLTLETTRCIFIIQGNSRTPMESLACAREQLAQLLDRYCRSG